MLMSVVVCQTVRGCVGRFARGQPVLGSTDDGSAELGSTMAFIQSMEFATERREELLELMGRWVVDAVQNGTAQRSTTAEDRSAPGRFVTTVWFESAEAAAENSNRPETGAFAAEFTSLCSEGPTFREFDVVDVPGG